MNRFAAVLSVFLCIFPALSWADSLGSAQGGQAANQSNLSGCIYRATPPVLTNGQQVGQQCNPSGVPVIGPTNSAGAYSAQTVGTSASTIIVASACKVFCDVYNTSSTATICINVGAAATISNGSCAAGEITLPPLWHRSWEGTYVPSDAVSAIASAASTPATVGAK